MYEIPSSHLKWHRSKIHMGRLATRNRYFTEYEVKGSHMKINYTREIVILHMEMEHIHK